MGGEDPAIARAAEVAAVGLRPDAHAGDVDTVATPSLRDDDARVRGAAIATLVRAGTSAAAEGAWTTGLRDASPAVRRRAAELTPLLASRTAPTVHFGDLVTRLVEVLADPDPTVIEAAAWALGELGDAAVEGGATTALAAAATTHDDPLAREAAVAALGALGDPAGLDAILAGCHDKPAIRRRAVLALAPFEGPAVDTALQAALHDRDWQVRQAAEDLLSAEEDRSEEAP